MKKVGISIFEKYDIDKESFIQSIKNVEAYEKYLDNAETIPLEALKITFNK